MGKMKYDEFQLAKRHKIAYQTLILLFAVVWLNGYVKSIYGVWAEPILESLVLMVVPGLYFAGASIWKNAYLRMHEKPTLILLLTGFTMGIGLLVIGGSVMSGTFHIIENGQLDGDIGLVLICLLFTTMFVLLLMRRMIDRRKV